MKREKDIVDSDTLSGGLIKVQKSNLQQNASLGSFKRTLLFKKKWNYNLEHENIKIWRASFQLYGRKPSLFRSLAKKSLVLRRRKVKGHSFFLIERKKKEHLFFSMQKTWTIFAFSSLFQKLAQNARYVGVTSGSVNSFRKLCPGHSFHLKENPDRNKCVWYAQHY